MRINTDFKDYYDGVLYNITEPNNKIWNRITKKNHKDLPKWYVNQNQNKLLALIGNNRFKYKNIWYVFKVVIISGEVYPYIIKSDINKDITTYIFDETKIVNILNNDRYIANYYETDLNIIKNGIRNLFDSFKDELMKVGELPVIVTIEQYINSYGSSSPEIIYSINNCLKDINFSKCLDSYTIAQNIDVYVNEQLNTENIPDNLSDLDKIRSYGFDEKYGFRKRK